MTDTGTQPTPHYCAHPVDALAATGCPRWPSCAMLDPDPTPPVGTALASLLGVVAFVVLVLVFVAIVGPLVIS